MRFRDALDELNERVSAVAALDRDSGETVTTIVGEPDELIRKVLSGYVSTDDTSHVMEFLHGGGRELTRMIRATENPAAAHAGVRFTVAQMIVLGIALGRGDSAKTRRVVEAAKVYEREFGHLIVDPDYPEVRELREALEALD